MGSRSCAARWTRQSQTSVFVKPGSRREAVERAYYPEHVPLSVKVDRDEVRESVADAPTRLDAPQEG
jgi:hypothetical protein